MSCCLWTPRNVILLVDSLKCQTCMDVCTYHPMHKNMQVQRRGCTRVTHIHTFKINLQKELKLSDLHPKLHRARHLPFSFTCWSFFDKHKHTHTHISDPTRACLCVCVWIYMRIYTHTQKHIQSNTSVFVRVCIHIYACTCCRAFVCSFPPSSSHLLTSHPNLDRQGPVFIYPRPLSAVSSTCASASFSCSFRLLHVIFVLSLSQPYPPPIVCRRLLSIRKDGRLVNTAVQPLAVFFTPCFSYMWLCV